MASNGFGTLFRITTWGESHGPAVGVVVDGCPAGVSLTVEEIDAALAQRAPGGSPYTSPRCESDRVQILSGLDDGITTGAPISMMIANEDVDSRPYVAMRHLLKPGHAHYSYLQKYGRFDFRGGGRASARETACRVAAGAVAKKLLAVEGIDLLAFITQIGPEEACIAADATIADLRRCRDTSALLCPDAAATERMIQRLEPQQAEGDSYGGVVSFYVAPMMVGIGEPIYQKLEAALAYAMMSIPATKGFEIGQGFAAAAMSGSQHNDSYVNNEGRIAPATNQAGGILAGISTGAPIYGRVAFKPTSSIRKAQQSVTTDGERVLFRLPEGSRHDPCVAIRAVPVVEAMAALVIVDALLLHQAKQQKVTNAPSAS